MALLGYARTSRLDQELSLDGQIATLSAAGCERVWSEHGSGARDDRPELAALLEYAREGDVVLVLRLDRWGRSLPHLIRLMSLLEDRGIGFRSLDDGIDTTTETGKFLYSVLACVGSFELSLVRSRTRFAAARSRELGRKPGPKPKLSPEQIDLAQSLYNSGEHTVAQIAAMLGGVSRATVYRSLQSGDKELTAPATDAS